MFNVTLKIEQNPTTITTLASTTKNEIKLMKDKTICSEFTLLITTIQCGLLVGYISLCHSFR